MLVKNQGNKMKIITYVLTSPFFWAGFFGNLALSALYDIGVENWHAWIILASFTLPFVFLDRK
jgi:hypothetical protein